MAMLNNKRVKYHVALLQCQKHHWGMVGIQPIYIHKNRDFGDGYG